MNSEGGLDFINIPGSCLNVTLGKDGSSCVNTHVMFKTAQHHSGLEEDKKAYAPLHLRLAMPISHAPFSV